MEIVPYHRASHQDAVLRFNQRLAAADVGFRLPVDDPPNGENGTPCREYFVAIDAGETYGGYCLKHIPFRLHGEDAKLSFLQMPLSWGAVNGQLARVGVSMLFDALQRSTYLYGLGMGSPQNKARRMLEAAGWNHVAVPFYYRVVAANRFAQNICLPGNKAGLQRALRIAGRLRLAPLAVWLHRKAGHGFSVRSERGQYDSVEVVPQFAGFADDLFDTHSHPYSIAATRTARAANQQYPPQQDKYVRLLVKRGGSLLGWAVVLDTPMENDKFFGNLRTGTLVDFFSAPEYASSVVAAADDFLEQHGVDLIVSNQLHKGWAAALKGAGYLRGPTNFHFFSSPPLTERLKADVDWIETAHLNRGSGHGVGHL